MDLYHEKKLFSKKLFISVLQGKLYCQSLSWGMRRKIMKASSLYIPWLWFNFLSNFACLHESVSIKRPAVHSHHPYLTIKSSEGTADALSNFSKEKEQHNNNAYSTKKVIHISHGFCTHIHIQCYANWVYWTIIKGDVIHENDWYADDPLAT